MISLGIHLWSGDYELPTAPPDSFAIAFTAPANLEVIPTGTEYSITGHIDAAPLPAVVQIKLSSWTLSSDVAVLSNGNFVFSYTFLDSESGTRQLRVNAVNPDDGLLYSNTVRCKVNIPPVIDVTHEGSP